MGVLGSFLKAIGYFVFIVGGLWGAVLCLAIIDKVAGFLGVLASLILIPITFVAAPWYAGFAWHNWFPLILVYGSCFGSSVLIVAGQALRGE
ncbi:MAG: hypothetical protein ACYCOR_11145 [Acidobacteriaceae bacterium]